VVFKRLVSAYSRGSSSRAFRLGVLCPAGAEVSVSGRCTQQPAARWPP
jgi:hypothetical protein